MNEPLPVTLPRTVLVVDDDERFRMRLVRPSRTRGFEARGARDGETPSKLAREETPEYAVVDLRMPGRSGLELVRELRAHRRDDAASSCSPATAASRPRSRRCGSARRTT